MKTKLLTLTELQAKKPAEIAKYVAELKKEHAQLSHDVTVGKEKKTHQFGLLRKAVARAKTVQTQQSQKEEK